MIYEDKILTPFESETPEEPKEEGEEKEEEKKEEGETTE